MYVLRCSLKLPVTREEAFHFFADAVNLEAITPPELRFQITTPLPVAMRVGALIDYRLRLFGVPFGWRTLISRWEPPKLFIDEQVRGPYAIWIHTHRFIEEGDGTLINDEVQYRLPLSLFGKAFHPLVRRQLDRIFDYRQEAVRRMLSPRDTSVGRGC